MEARVAKLEDFAAETRERLARIETRLEEMVTKADLNEKIQELRVEMHKGFADIIKWMVGLAVVISATAITVMTFVLNNATPKNPQAPVIVYTQPAPSIPAPKQ